MAERREGGGWVVPPPLFYFHPFQLHTWLTLLLGPIFVDGCIRRSLFQPQTTTTTTTTSTLRSTTPPMEETTATTLTPSHKQACLPDEVHSTNCLHGGTCYVVVLNENRQSFCHCTEEWTGKRCEQYFIDPGILASMEENMRTANIAAGVSVCILVLFVLLLATYVYMRKRKKRHSRGDYSPADASTRTALEANGTTTEGREVQAPSASRDNVCIEAPGDQLLSPAKHPPFPTLDVIDEPHQRNTESHLHLDETPFYREQPSTLQEHPLTLQEHPSAQHKLPTTAHEHCGGQPPMADEQPMLLIAPDRVPLPCDGVQSRL